MSELPKGWIESTLGQLFPITLGQSPPSSTYNSEKIGLPFFQGKAEFGEFYPKVKKWCSGPKKIAKKDSILISVRAPVGPTNLALDKCCIGRGLASIEPVYDQNPRFILYQLRSIERTIDKNATGTTFRAITGSELKKVPFLFPPLPEQHRIVAKIEELFTKLDAGVEALKKTKALLKKYRQSVLKAAVEGKLTEEWRKENGKRIEPASVLLERIQAERKQRLGKNYKPPKPIDTTNLPDLPEGWVWAEMGQLIEWSNGKGLTHKDIISGPHNVYGGNGIIGTHNKFLSEQKCIVVGRVGAYCGNVNIASNKSWITDNAIYSKWISKHFEISYSKLLLTSLGLNNIAGGSGQPYVKQSLLNPIIIPLPSISEQNQIVIEIERLTSIIDESEQIIDAELKRSQSLRQSILKRAFEGKLVPQDPADEPASVLLERIRKEKHK